MNEHCQRPAPDVHFEFAHELGASKQARQALKPLWETPEDPIEDSVTLAASELVTNVVIHTAGGGSMNVWDPKAGIPLRLEVEDSDHSRPVPVEVASEAGGRGLWIVDGAADDWGFEQTRAGKVVWAEFARPSTSPD